jgi:hypothetical protein
MAAQSNIVASLTPEVLALLAASYGKAETAVAAAESHAVRANAPRKASKLRAVKAAAVEADAPPASKAPAAFLPIELPPIGTYTAALFLRKMRALGPIFVCGTEITHDPRPFGERNAATFVSRRDEAIKLIAGYCGFDRTADFGDQLSAAKMRAMRELRPSHPFSDAEAPHTVRPSVQGYVSGMPDEQAKRVRNLLARERLAAETMAEHEALAADETVEASERVYHAQLAVVEQGRLDQIRADLRAMGIAL